MTRRCWCGRPVTTASSCGCCCVEHDGPLYGPDDDRFDCGICGGPVEDPDDVFCPDCIEALNQTDVFILHGRRVDTLQPDARFL